MSYYLRAIICRIFWHEMVMCDCGYAKCMRCGKEWDGGECGDEYKYGK